MALPADDLRLRFGTMLAPAAIGAYVDRIDFERDAVFAVHDERLAIIGAAHVGFFEDAAELGVSVSPGHRGQGIGSSLAQASTLATAARCGSTCTVLPRMPQ